MALYVGSLVARIERQRNAGMASPNGRPTRILGLAEARPEGSMRATRALTSAAFLTDLVERLSEALRRKNVDGPGAARRGPLDGDVAALAHGVDQLGLLGRILDPSAVIEGVHRIGRPAEFQGGVRIGLETISDDDRDLVLHLFGGTGGDEQESHIARSVGR